MHRGMMGRIFALLIYCLSSNLLEAQTYLIFYFQGQRYFQIFIWHSCLGLVLCTATLHCHTATA